MIVINTFNQLIEFIRANNLNVEQSKKLIEPCLNVIILEDYNTKEDLLKAIETYWNKWKNIKERPIFIGLDMDVK